MTGIMSKTMKIQAHYENSKRFINEHVVDVDPLQVSSIKYASIKYLPKFKLNGTYILID